MEIVRDPLLESGRPVVRHYRPGEIRVRGTAYSASLILTPQQIIADWRPQDAADLAAADLERLLALDPRPDMVLLGTGERQRFPQRDVLAPLLAAGIGLEIMDTAAACRTWNVVLSEGRRAAAALIIK